MKGRAAVLGLALLVALPAWAQRGGGHSDGHSGGARSSGGGAQGGAAAHGATASPAGATASRGVAAHVSMAAPVAASASHLAGAPRTQSASTMLGGRVSFVPSPAAGRAETSARSVNVLPRLSNANASAVAPTYPSRVTLAPMAASAAPQRAVTKPGPVRPNFAVVPPAPTVVVTPSEFPFFPRGVFGHQVFFQNSVVFVAIGNGFFSPFFFEPVGFDPFLANPFCPFCATGRVDLPPFQRGIFSPFAPRRVFFDEFLQNRFFSPFAQPPFFFGGFFPTFVPAFEPGMTEQAPAEQAPAGEANTAVYAMQPEEAAPPNPAAEQPASPPITLLVLKDGWMYGLVDYWLEDGSLHYITSYGGENSLPLERIDFDKTVQLNWERGIEFVLRPGPRSR